MWAARTVSRWGDTFNFVALTLLIYDLTGSYHAAFLNGLAFNALNLSIAGFLLFKARQAKRR